MTVKPTCAICGAVTDHSHYLCTDHQDKLEQALGDIPATERGRSLLADLELTRTRQSRGGNLTRGPAQRDHVLFHASRRDDRLEQVTTALRNALFTWARIFTEDRGGRPASGMSGDVAGYLQRHAGWAGTQPWAGEFYHDIVPVVKQAASLIDRRAQRFYAGTCMTPLDEQQTRHCDAELYYTADDTAISCTGCGIVHDIDDRRAWILRYAEDHLGPARDIAKALDNLLDGIPVREDMLRGYIRRGRLLCKGVDLEGREVYRVGDVLDIVYQVAAERDRRDAQRARRMSA